MYELYCVTVNVIIAFKFNENFVFFECLKR